MQPNTSTVLSDYPMTCLSSDFYAAYFNLSVKQNQVPSSEFRVPSLELILSINWKLETLNWKLKTGN